MEGPWRGSTSTRRGSSDSRRGLIVRWIAWLSRFGRGRKGGGPLDGLLIGPVQAYPEAFGSGEQLRVAHVLDRLAGDLARQLDLRARRRINAVYELDPEGCGLRVRRVGVEDRADHAPRDERGSTHAPTLAGDAPVPSRSSVLRWWSVPQTARLRGLLGGVAARGSRSKRTTPLIRHLSARAGRCARGHGVNAAVDERQAHSSLE